MEEEKMTVSEECESEVAEEGSDDSRREFMTKLAAAAGAVVAAGMLTGSEAEAATAVRPQAGAKVMPMAAAGAKLKNLGSASVANVRGSNGLGMKLTNKQVVQAIARESLGLNVPGAEVMELNLTWK